MTTRQSRVVHQSRTGPQRAVRPSHTGQRKLPCPSGESRRGDHAERGVRRRPRGDRRRSRGHDLVTSASHEVVPNQYLRSKREAERRGRSTRQRRQHGVVPSHRVAKHHVALPRPARRPPPADPTPRGLHAYALLYPKGRGSRKQPPGAQSELPDDPRPDGRRRGEEPRKTRADEAERMRTTR